jgi:hypothetical protein
MEVLEDGHERPRLLAVMTISSAMLWSPRKTYHYIPSLRIYDPPRFRVLQATSRYYLYDLFTLNCDIAFFGFGIGHDQAVDNYQIVLGGHCVCTKASLS